MAPETSPNAPVRWLQPAEPWVPSDIGEAFASLSAGERVVRWMEAHEGIAIETEGQNRGPWARFFLRGDEGLAYCAAALLRAMEAVGAPWPSGDPKRFGRRWGGYYPNRTVDTWEKNAKRAGTWFGPAIPPHRGALVFYRSRRGSDPGRRRRGRPLPRHIDICTDFDPGERHIEVIGANVSDTIKRRRFRLGHPDITGFGFIGPSLTEIRKAA